jgi:hypothetical protein
MDSMQNVEWTFQNSKAVRAWIRNQGESHQTVGLEQLYGKPFTVKRTIGGLFVNTMWCMPDGTQIDAEEELGDITQFMAMFTSPQYKGRRWSNQTCPQKGN